MDFSFLNNVELDTPTNPVIQLDEPLPVLHDIEPDGFGDVITQAPNASADDPQRERPDPTWQQQSHSKEQAFIAIVTCVYCLRRSRTSLERLGRRMRCRHCNSVFPTARIELVEAMTEETPRTGEGRHGP